MCCVKHTCDDPSTSAVWIIKDAAVNRRKKPSWAEDSACPGIHQCASHTWQYADIRHCHSSLQFLRWHVHSPTVPIIQGITFMEMMRISRYFTHSLHTKKKKKSSTLVNLQMLLATKLWMIDRFFCVQWIQNIGQSRPFDNCDSEFESDVCFCVFCRVNRRREKNYNIKQQVGKIHYSIVLNHRSDWWGKTVLSCP